MLLSQNRNPSQTGKKNPCCFPLDTNQRGVHFEKLPYGHVESGFFTSENVFSVTRPTVEPDEGKPLEDETLMFLGLARNSRPITP